MKAAIYSPYLDTFGGGERYMMTIAEVLAESHSVDVFLDPHLQSFGRNYLREKLSRRFNLNLENVNFIKAPVGKSSSAFLRILFLKRYDILFYLTDGSIFYPAAKKNILHIQSPLAGQPAKNLWGKFKLKGWDLIIYNSFFTYTFSKANWPLRSQVIYPPVDVGNINSLPKKRNILSVGRFFGFLKDKKHELLINVFKDLFEDGSIAGWSLHLVGSAGNGDMNYLEQLGILAKQIPVTFYPNLDYGKLIRLYGESSIYWHAAGFGETDPTKMEHFGISTVEAMAGGCVPIAIGNAGQKEIVEDGISGYLWNEVEELKKRTLKLIKEENLRKKIAVAAQNRAKQFSKENFKQEIKKIIQEK